MKNKRQLREETASLKSLQIVIGAYEEIAAMRMRKVKKSVLQNRDFFSGLNDIYRRVKYTYKVYQQGHKVRKKGNLQLLSDNGKTISVLISSNTGLYGDIVKKTFDLFLTNVTNSSTDVLITGRVGKQLFDYANSTVKNKKDYKYIEMSDNGVDRDALKAIAEYILNYANIVVYHGLYVSILSQEAQRTYITGKVSDIIAEQASTELKCIIEPSVEEVTKFFERQILSSLFEQSVYESSLSKFASRMVNLDVASENIKDLIKKVDFSKLKAKHARENATQLERLSGLTLW